jgi:hypothetical protein
MPGAPVIKTLRPGDSSKPDPYTIVIVANPALEKGEDSDKFEADPITKQQSEFDDCASYINRCLFGELEGQRERFLSNPSVRDRIKVVSLFVTGLRSTSDNSLITRDHGLLIARRNNFVQFLSRYSLSADVAFAISASKHHKGASAWATTDDASRSGVEFTLDGRRYFHRHHCRIPGTVAMHAESDSLTAAHEFGHASSSYSDGYLSDIYVDLHDEDVHKPVINKRWGRPIPDQFCTYDDSSYRSDQKRDGLGYPAAWKSYHCELSDPELPAIMDNYTAAADERADECQHDRITRQFLLDRIRAKCAR